MTEAPVLPGLTATGVALVKVKTPLPDAPPPVWMEPPLLRVTPASDWLKPFKSKSEPPLTVTVVPPMTAL